MKSFLEVKSGSKQDKQALAQPTAGLQGRGHAGHTHHVSGTNGHKVATCHSFTDFNKKPVLKGLLPDTKCRPVSWCECQPVTN